MSMKAVILAAGMGTRLGEHAQGRPKCLVDVDGSTLLERSLTNLDSSGITEVVIVTGFRGDLIRELIGTNFKGCKITYVENPHYASTGSMYSLAQARHLLDTDTMVIEADLLYQEDALSRLIDAPEKDVILVGRLLHSGDDVLIRTDEQGHIVDLGKKIEDEAAAAGALLGISKYSPEFMQKLFSTAADEFEDGHKNYHYEETVLVTSRTGHPVWALVCHDIHWIEVDNVNDLRRAREEVYPKILEAQSAESQAR